MKALLLVVCSVIAISQAGPFSDKEKKLEHVLNDLEVVLQDLQEQSPHGQEMTNEQQSMESEDDSKHVPGRITGEILKAGNANKQTNTGSQEDSEVLLHATDIKSATAQIEAAGGRVTMQLGYDLLVAQWPGDVALAQTNFASASAHIPSSASEATLSNAEAYWKMRADKLKPQPKVQRWTDGTPPKSFPQPEGHLGFGANSPYRQTLSGKILVLVIGVSGPGSTAMSSSEWSTVKSEVDAGLQFWTDKAPASASLSFVVYSGCAYISAANPTSCSSNEACHNVFADAALDYFGYSAGQAGKDELAEEYKQIAGADGAYIAFFSKYSQSHFAYAYFGGGPVYMQYSNDGWGSDQIDRVFAHETGHVFNAPDEYTSCNCNTAYGKGSCTATNDNCNDYPYTSCTYSQSSCIMDNNDLSSICATSRKHVGWC